MPFFSRRLQSVSQWIQINFLPNAFKYFLPYWLVQSLPWSSGYSDVVHQSPTHWRLFRDRHLPRGSMACIHGATPGRTHTHAATQPGNMLQLQFAENYGDYEFQWLKQYGPMYRVKGCFGVEDRLVVSDPLALKHILNDPSFKHPPTNLKVSSMIFGEKSVWCSEGDEHRRLRAAMSAGFSGRGIRTFLPAFVAVAKTIVRKWENLCPPSSIRLDVAKFMDHATLDIISNAALGYPISTIQNPEHPLARSHLHILTAALTRSKSGVISEFITKYTPASVLRLALRLPVDPMRAIFNFQTVTKQIMEERAQELETGEKEGDDLLSIIYTGSLASSKLGTTLTDVVDQLPLFLLAGQETTATSLSWCLYQLAQDLDFQQNLRQEILNHLSKSGLEVEYDNMPLLNALLKVTGPLLERYASEDYILPLSSEIITSTGKRLRELPIQKGQFIYVAAGSYQRLEALWGADAHEFKPSRWLEEDPCAGQALGPYAHLLTFFGGPRVCPGWRFALLEMQVILTELLAKFTFSLPGDTFVRYAGTQFPSDSEGVKGLWLSVERVQAVNGGI
ncbi:cytochrome P450 [Mycena leptocephala]|nr:cytochrome P450 [Mycena leptocephala]